MKVNKKERKAVHEEVSKHGFPYRRESERGRGFKLGNCLRCGAAPPSTDFEEATEKHVVDVAIDFVTGLLEAKYQPKRPSKAKAAPEPAPPNPVKLFGEAQLALGPKAGDTCPVCGADMVQKQGGVECLSDHK